jgi:hypothetical protein
MNECMHALRKDGRKEGGREKRKAGRMEEID